ncbi:hypothetical protein BH23PLA1_BH23PLA1_10340 [soil metagenome]
MVESNPPADRGIGRAIWFFVALGISLRIARYAMNFPIWWDEAFVAVNFLRRDYLDLLRPLDYGQVGPLLFLWAELSAVRLWGFSELSLRAFPMACAVLSVPLFRFAAGRVLSGLPLLLAVAVFAVSYHPIRHSADIKPYASDVLVSTLLLAMALQWYREPRRAGWLWGLVAVVPMALGLSNPAVFVAGGIGLAIGPGAWRAGRSARLAGVSMLLVTAATFFALYFGFTRAQAEATLPGMRGYWSEAFPPVGDPLAILKWVVMVHAGDMLSYPCGGDRGGSGLSLLLLLAGVVALWRSRQKTVLAACLIPFGLALLAATLRRYPYGDAARTMQYLAPATCLLIGAGAAACLSRISKAGGKTRALRMSLLALAMIGIVPTVAELWHPYRSVHSDQARRFAREFWPEVARGAEVACLRWDLGIDRWDTIDLDVAVYLCNQAIYAPQRQADRHPLRASLATGRPLRVVRSKAEAVDDAPAWLEPLQRRYTLRRRVSIVVDMAGPGASRSRPERYEVFEFWPRPSALTIGPDTFPRFSASASSAIGSARGPRR